MWILGTFEGFYDIIRFAFENVLSGFKADKEFIISSFCTISDTFYMSFFPPLDYKLFKDRGSVFLPSRPQNP